MKRLKILLSLILIMGVVLIFNNTKSIAAEVQYTDNVIPVMTSDTSPSGIASASCFYTNADGSKQLPYLAFDHSTAKMDVWGTLGNTTSGWLAYEFLDKKYITKYTIKKRDGEYDFVWQSPKNWTFEAWNEDASDWIILDTQTNITGWTTSSKKEFTFTNTEYYHKYRINVSSIEGNPKAKKIDNGVAIGELEMMETVSSPPKTTLKVV